MNRHDETTFTHYTEIAEAKQIDVRSMQAAVLLSIVRVIAAMPIKVLGRSPHPESVQVVDHP